MTLSSSLGQSAPDRLEIRSGGGCISVFGVPFFAAGLFLILVALQILPLSNSEEVPARAWPLMLVMGLVFAAVGGWLVFGRTRIVLDAAAGRVSKEHRALVRVRYEAHNLHDYRAVALDFTAGDSDTADSYDLKLLGEAGTANLALLGLTEYGPALDQAEALARVARLPLLDRTTDHVAVVEFDRRGKCVGERTAARPEGGAGRFEDVPRPASLQSDVEVGDRRVRIHTAARPLNPLTLLALLVPLALATYFGPRVLDFFDATGTPAGVQVCASTFAVLFFLGLPLLEFAGAFLRGRHGATTVTVTREGISVEERGAWRRGRRTIPAGDIVGVDYSTPESAMRPARAGDFDPAATDAALGKVRWLGRWIKGRGVIVKTRQGFVELGGGLPGREIHYLWALVTQALEGGLPDRQARWVSEG